MKIYKFQTYNRYLETVYRNVIANSKQEAETHLREKLTGDWQLYEEVEINDLPIIV